MAFQKRLAVLCLVLHAALSGCSATITSFTDTATNAHIARMIGNRLAGGITSVELNVQRFEKENVPTYSLILIYAGPTFINIISGKSLILTIDGMRYELQGKGSIQNRNTISIGLVEEKSYYHDVDPELLRTIANAGEVEVEVHGTGKIVKRHFKGQNFINIREFCDLYVTNRFRLDHEKASNSLESRKPDPF